MNPPKQSRPPRLRFHFDEHAKDQIRIRRYKREQIVQILEEFSGYAVEQDEVLRPGEPPYGDGRMVLEVEQNGLLHRIVFFFEKIKDCFGDLLDPVEATVHTVIFRGTSPSLPNFEAVPLDGSYDLPNRDWEKQP